MKKLIWSVHWLKKRWSENVFVFVSKTQHGNETIEWKISTTKLEDFLSSVKGR